MTRKRLQALIAAVLMLLGLSAVPSFAGDQELTLLKSYIGNWSGQGTLVGGDEPETFRCRLNIAKGNASKINYSGRCALVNMNLSVSGTIAFDDTSNRYLAAMSSNAGFTGQAVGLKKGEQINFDLASQQIDRGGNTVRIGSKIKLDGGKITVDFEIEFNDSGDVLTASVPFDR